MGAVNLIVVVESVQSLITHTDDNTFHIASLAAVAAALGVKLALFGYCYTLRKASSQVEVLWEDHRNDLFINSFGLLMSAGGSKLRWWLDPMGAIIVRVVGACTGRSGSDRGDRLRPACLLSGATRSTASLSSWRANQRHTSSCNSSFTKPRHSASTSRPSTQCALTTCVLLPPNAELDTDVSTERARLLCRGRYRHGRRDTAVAGARHQPATTRQDRGPAER
jgi:hypothetical protein